MFYGCNALTEVTLGEGIAALADHAFAGCPLLEKVILPDSLETIGTYAFKNCASLNSVTLGSNVKTVGSHAFYGCNALTAYCAAEKLPDGWSGLWNTSFRPVFWNCEVKDGAVTAVRGAAENVDAVGGVSAPEREGYTFVGWTIDSSATEPDSAIGTPADSQEPVYAVWKEAEETPVDSE